VVNARIAQQRADADRDVAAARSAAREQVASGVASVAARMAELAVGTRPDDATVRRAVEAVMASGVRS
jgi:F0F1-type ATP synthase membrane subunit b/b'